MLAVLSTTVLLLKRRHAAYTEFTLWLWLVTPWLRRVVDWRSHYHSSSPVISAAPLVCLVALPLAFRGKRRRAQDAELALTIGLVAVSYAALVGAVRNGFTASGGAFLTWGAPLVFGLYLLRSGPDFDELIPVLRRVAVGGCVLLGVYGVRQFLAPPVWDKLWMVESKLGSIGTPAPQKVRVFSMLNSPGPMATTLGVLIAMLLTTRGLSRWLALPAGLGAFGLALVRSAWLGLGVVVVLMVFGRDRRGWRVLPVLAALIALTLAVSGGAGKQLVINRLNNSVATGTSDPSLVARLQFHQQLGPKLLPDFLGQGLGATGTTAKLASSATVSTSTPALLTSVDSAFLEVLYDVGSPLGVAYLVAILVATFYAWRRARRRSGIAQAMGAAAVGILAQAPFGDVLISVTGIFFWAAIAILGRLDENDLAPAEGTS